ncbi:hypothetical protein [Streptomyces johnsoniae]|uniref:Integral membrane protein n=1 Tax=Streptomyces johnsoniae TaxID=3075532 RepID=A0ABU2RYU4_9ACTN|nr:hypothetical protein [Streptomyces sp. DSM 41886]MDT0441932.1 hypothetical protein [Streptomyces sp. DSM 41886]
MGIEGEQLVLDYLSRVGDLAHGTRMSATQRATLVNGLRDEIGRRRAEAGGADSRASVKRILGKMGRPEDVVAAAAEHGSAPGTTPASVPAPAPVPAPRPVAEPPRKERSRRERRTKERAAKERAPVESPPAGPPVESAPAGPPGGPDAPAWPEVPLGGPQRDAEPWPDGQIGRFFGGIEIPEMLRASPAPAEADPDAALDAALDPETAAEAEEAVRPTEPERAARTARGRRWARAALSGRRVGGPVEYLGVLLLVAGTVAGSIVVLGLGWLVTYWSPRLSRRAAQWATFGMPALVGGGYLLWLLGRTAGYWGPALAEGEADGAFADHWPWLLRGAALASAAFLLHRARRKRPPADA